jgi:hypothetical protein
LEHIFHCGGEYTEVVKQKFAEMYPKSHVPHRNTVQQSINKFRETESVAGTLRSGRPTVLIQDKVLNISDHVMKGLKIQFANCLSK